MKSAPVIELAFALQRENFSLDVAMTLPGAGISVLYGASGSGKTTVLRCIAGLAPDVKGRVRVGDHWWACDESGINLPPHQRSVGYVFQEASLFEHLNVRQNIEFGFKRAAVQGARSIIDDAVALLGIERLLTRAVTELSGGERQRVAIARALATQPQLLLLDEPLSALDQARKQDVFPWLERLRDELRIPMIYVTHAMEELTRLGDHLVVLEGGRVKAAGPVAQTLSSLDAQHMPSQEVGVLMDGVVEQIEAPWRLAKVCFPEGHLWVRDDGMTPGQRVRLRVLARDVSLTLAEPIGTSIQNHWAVEICEVRADAHPSQVLVRMRWGSQYLWARITQRAWSVLGLAIGQTVWAQLKSVSVAH